MIKVEYRIDNEWKEMDYTESIDPDYTNDVLKWDTTQELFTGRRPNVIQKFKHIWTALFSRKLELGNPRSRNVRAKDRYGKTYTTKSTFEVKIIDSINAQNIVKEKANDKLAFLCFEVVVLKF